MFNHYQLTPKDEDEMEDFRDYDDENAEPGSKLDEYSDTEEEEEIEEEHHAPTMPAAVTAPATTKMAKCRHLVVLFIVVYLEISPVLTSILTRQGNA